MENLLPLFSANLLPILITAGAGFLLGRYIELDPRTISRIIFYLFSPCLVFKLLTENQLEQNAILQIIGFAVANTLVIGLITYLVCKLFKFERKIMVAVLLGAMFVNAGNYGLTLNDFAFGKQALAYASIYFICSSIMIYTVGIVIASMGEHSFKDSLGLLLRFPAIYALAIALIYNRFQLTIPAAIQRPIDLLAAAAIPGMLVLLGLQLQRADLTNHRLAIVSAVIIRIVVSPLVALGMSTPFALQGVARQAAVIEASTPTAVMVTVLSTEFEVEPALVTTIVTATTLLSPLSLTPLLLILGG